MPRGSSEQFQGTVAQHYEALCTSFVIARRRARLLTKPGDLFEDLCHRPWASLDPRYAVSLSAHAVVEPGSLAIIRHASRATRAVYFGGWAGSEVAEYPLAECLEMLERSGGAIASVEPGQLALYCSEPMPKRDWFLLVADPRRRESAARLTAGLAQRDTRPDQHKTGRPR